MYTKTRSYGTPRNRPKTVQFLFTVLPHTPFRHRTSLYMSNRKKTSTAHIPNIHTLQAVSRIKTEGVASPWCVDWHFLLGTVIPFP